MLRPLPSGHRLVFVELSGSATLALPTAVAGFARAAGFCWRFACADRAASSSSELSGTAVAPTDGLAFGVMGRGLLLGGSGGGCGLRGDGLRLAGCSSSSLLSARAAAVALRFGGAGLGEGVVAFRCLA